MALQEGCIVWCDHKKKDLYQLILPLKPKEKINKTDALLAHLLTHVWPNRTHTGKIMKLVHESNVTADMNLQKLHVTKS